MDDPRVAQFERERADAVELAHRAMATSYIGAPPPGLAVEVLCEDHSGTYQLPFACRMVDGQWRNHESGGAVEATVIGWRMPRVRQSGVA